MFTCLFVALAIKVNVNRSCTPNRRTDLFFSNAIIAVSGLKLWNVQPSLSWSLILPSSCNNWKTSGAWFRNSLMTDSIEKLWKFSTVLRPWYTWCLVSSTAAIWFCRTGNEIWVSRVFSNSATLCCDLSSWLSRSQTRRRNLCTCWSLSLKSLQGLNLLLKWNSYSSNSRASIRHFNTKYKLVSVLTLLTALWIGKCFPHYAGHRLGRVVFVGEVVLDIIGYTRELDTRTNIGVFYFPIFSLQPFCFSGLHYHKCWINGEGLQFIL